MVDVRLLRLFRQYGFEFNELGPPRLYNGHIIIPCLLDLHQTQKNLWKKDPKLYSFFFHGLFGVDNSISLSTGTFLKEKLRPYKQQ